VNESQHGTFPLGLVSVFEGTIVSLEEMERVWIPDALNNANTVGAELAVGFASVFTIRNDGPAVLRFFREFSVDGVAWFSTGGVGVNIGAGTTLILQLHVLPALPFYRWRFLNNNAVDPLTFHAVHSLNCTRWL